MPQRGFVDRVILPAGAFTASFARANIAARLAGAYGCVSRSRTVSHGARPGVAVFEILEYDVPAIPPFGTLTATDGTNSVDLNRCEVAGIGFGRSRPFTVSHANHKDYRTERIVSIYKSLTQIRLAASG